MRFDDVQLALPAGWDEAVREAGGHAETSLSPKLLRIRQLEHSVAALNVIAASLPKEYGWRFTTAETFTRNSQDRARRGGTALEFNAFYWRDVAATTEAYMVTSVWRLIDLCQSGFRCIDQEAIVPAAILARSALESSVQFATDARTLSASLEELLKLDFESGLIASEELEAYLLKTVYASRRSDADEIYRSRNILTVLEKLMRIPTGEPILEEYEFLCEVTHPNFLGRSIYITRAEVQPDGSELRIVSPTTGVTGAAVAQSAIWAFSWAIEAQALSTHLLQNAVADLLARLPASTDHLRDEHGGG